MKNISILIVSLLFFSTLFASGSNYTAPSGYRLVLDRFRNCAAVSTQKVGTSNSIFLTSFGLSPRDNSEKSGKEAWLIRHCILNHDNGDPTNGDDGFELTDWEPIQFNEDFINNHPVLGGTLSGYDLDADIPLMQADDQFVGQLRIDGATGFWASPVLVEDNNSITNGKLILLNKSGVLFCMKTRDFANSESVEWKINLRDQERFGESYKYEYMSTPLVIDDYIYVGGLSQIFKINISSGNIVSSYPTASNDQIVAPMAFHSATYFNADGDECTLYYIVAVTYTGNVHIINRESMVAVRTTSLETNPLCLTRPYIHNDGYIYFGVDGAGSDVRYIEQPYRILDNILTSDQIGTIINITSEESCFQLYSCDDKEINILPDGRIYTATNSYSSEVNNYDNTDNIDTGNLSSDNDENDTYVNNTPIIFSADDYNRVCIVGVSNEFSWSEELDLQDNTPFCANIFYPTSDNDVDDGDSNDYDLLIKGVGYEKQTSGYVGNSPASVSVRTLTYGGLSPYFATDNNIDLFFCDDNGYIWTFSPHFQANLNDYAPDYNYSNGKPIVSDLGEPKHMKGLPNTSEYDLINFEATFINVSNTSIYDLNNGVFPQVYLNSYLCDKVIPIDNSSFIAQFKALQNGNQYTLRMYKNTGVNVSQFNYNSCIDISNPQTFDYVNLVSIDPGETHTFDGITMTYQTISLGQNSSLNIENDSHITCTSLYLNPGSIINIDDDSSLEVDNVYNLSVQPTDPEATINVVGNADFVRLYNDGNLRFFTNRNENIRIQEIYSNTINRTIEFDSNNLSSTDYGVEISGDFFIDGDIFVNDCVSLSSHLKIYAGRVLSMQSNGKLILRSGWLNNYGNIDVQEGGCMNLYAELRMRENSKLFNFGSIEFSNGVLQSFKNNVIINNSNSIEFSNESMFRIFTDFDENNNTPIPSDINITGNGSFYFNQSDLFVDELSSAIVSNIVFSNSNASIEGTFTLGGCMDILDSSEFKISGQNASFIINSNSTIRGNTVANGDLSANELGDRIVCYDQGLITTESGATNITITGVDGKMWNGIKIYEPRDGAIYSFENCDISNIKNFRMSTRLQSSAVLYFKNLDYHNAGTIWVGGCTLKIGDGDETQDNFIHHNIATPIYVTESSLYLKDCRIVKNGYNTSSELIASNCHGLNIYLTDEIIGEIHNCLIAGNSGSGANLRAAGIYFNNSVIENNFIHGIIGTLAGAQTYNNCEFLNNNLCEVAGEYEFFNTSRWSDRNNTFSDITYPNPNQNAYDSYILHMKGWQEGFAPIDFTGNVFPQLANQDFENRFYPCYEAFVIDGTAPGSDAGTLFATGLSQFYTPNYFDAELTLKSLIETYIQSTQASAAMTLLFMIEIYTNQDYTSLENYLNALVIPETAPAYKSRKDVINLIYVKKEDFLAAITELEEIIQSTEDPEKLIYAMIDQGYCYLMLTEQGNRNLPQNCTMKPVTMEEYLDMVRELELRLYPQQSANEIPELSSPALIGNYPNPFNPDTNIRFYLPESGKVKMDIYNLKGQLVKNLSHNNYEKGYNTITWNGKDNVDKRTSSGIYFYKFEVNGKVIATRKMLLLK